MKRFFRFLWGALAVIFTGGKFGSSVRVDRSAEYAQRQEQRMKQFQKFGTHSCKICGTKIPGNKTHCGSCFHKYIKK
jgi:hypothetical protein